MFLRLFDDLGVRRHVMARGRDLTAGGDITPPAGHGMTGKTEDGAKSHPVGHTAHQRRGHPARPVTNTGNLPTAVAGSSHDSLRQRERAPAPR
ncbi:hypothetical protein, partial [Streptomyces sp. RKCA744]|uniref:hypothetical protein n=1 Tax=Streptomyces sp. RKCA744 TaxID=2959340 RepID=UPI00209D51FD